MLSYVISKIPFSHCNKYKGLSMWTFFFYPLNGKTIFVREMRLLWAVQKLLSLTFGSTRLWPTFWKKSLGKDRANFSLVGIMGKGEEKSDHYILHWDKNNYLEENCLQNHTVGRKTSHSFPPKGWLHYWNICLRHWEGLSVLSAVQKQNN